MPEFIPVQVPAEHVTEVYALLARLGGKAAEQPEKGGLDEEEDWSIEDLRALRDCPMASVKRMAQVLDVLAAKPGVPAAFSVVAKEVGLTRDELQGQTGGFSRWIGKRWPDHEISWPITFENGPAVDTTLSTETFYTMDKPMAKKWKQVRAE